MVEAADQHRVEPDEAHRADAGGRCLRRQVQVRARGLAAQPGPCGQQRGGDAQVERVRERRIRQRQRRAVRVDVGTQHPQQQAQREQRGRDRPVSLGRGAHRPAACGARAQQQHQQQRRHHEPAEPGPGADIVTPAVRDGSALQGAQTGEHQHAQRMNGLLQRRRPARGGAPQHHAMHGQRHRPGPPAAVGDRLAQFHRATDHCQGEEWRMPERSEGHLRPIEPRREQRADERDGAHARQPGGQREPRIDEVVDLHLRRDQCPRHACGDQQRRHERFGVGQCAARRAGAGVAREVGRRERGRGREQAVDQGGIEDRGRRAVVVVCHHHGQARQHHQCVAECARQCTRLAHAQPHQACAFERPGAGGAVRVERERNHQGEEDDRDREAGVEGHGQARARAHRARQQHIEAGASASRAPAAHRSRPARAPRSRCRTRCRAPGRAAARR